MNDRLPLRPPLCQIPVPAPRAILRQTFYCRMTRMPSGVRLGAIHSLLYCQYLQHKTEHSHIHTIPNGNPSLAYLPNCKWCVDNDVRHGPQFKEITE